MRLSVVIVNYRTPQLVLDCLQSLHSEINPQTDRAVVVDNASGDASLDQIKEGVAANHWESWVQVLPSPLNRGFSAGNNLGIEALRADAYLLLNSDTIVRSGAISLLLSAPQSDSKAGLVSPRLEWPDETPQVSCFRYVSPVSEFISAAATGPITKLLNLYNVPLPLSDAPFEPEWTSFACVLIRREVIEQLGLMDEGYFMYYDDVDYCRRAMLAGWRILHWPEARVVHLRGGSGPVKDAIATRRRPKRYLYESRSRYFGRFYGGPLGCLMANVCWVAGRIVSYCRELFGKKEPHTCEHAIIDIWTNWYAPLQDHSMSERKT